jgi:hypothetical protein
MMTESRRLAGVVGPTLVAVAVSEHPLVQPHLYDAQIPPVVYLSGVLIFVSGLAIVRAHNQWRWDLTVLVTLTGWLALAVGLVRMFGASAYQQVAASTAPATLMILEGAVLLAGLVMTVQVYVVPPK